MPSSQPCRTRIMGRSDHRPGPRGRHPQQWRGDRILRLPARKPTPNKDGNINSISLGKPIGTEEGNLLLASIATNNNGTTMTATHGLDPDQPRPAKQHRYPRGLLQARPDERGRPVRLRHRRGRWEEIAASILRYTGVDQTTATLIDASAGASGKSRDADRT